MSSNQSNNLYNYLCALFFQEQKRLEEDVEEYYKRLQFRRNDPYLILDYVKAVTRAEYFHSYMIEILRYLALFGD